MSARSFEHVLVVAATGREFGAVTGVGTLTCGIGPVEAAAATARALATRPSSALLHVGLAGARRLPVGTIVIGTEAVYCDLGAAIPVVDRVTPDPRLLAALQVAFPDLPALPIGTSARVGGTTKELQVEAMEGFAVLRAAELAGVPSVEVRVVANEIDEPDRTKWRFDEALETLAEILPRLVAVASAP